MRALEVCPCGSGKGYDNCCQPFHQGSLFPETAEALMRSRYSAFVVQNAAYLLQTWAARNRPTELSFEDDLVWTGLKILDKKQGRATDTKGWVKFRASYREGEESGEMVEKSLFEKDAQGHWCYVSGKSL